MTVFDVISLLGGLGFFLYGMSMMGGGLKQAAGGKLEGILQKFSSTPIRGILFGTLVTAVIQSSSATAVMVVGFVNSGLMQLSQAIGVIMGANIGTTATGWILSLAGISGESTWIQLMKPTSFAPLLVFVCALVLMFAKVAKRKAVASVVMGFATLMVGMSMMSGAAEPLAEMPEFTGLLTLFSNPILGVLVGILITAAIQSSSASVGILQALALTGSITYSTAIPLILGMDIGACVPVLLSSISANKNGKRAAFTYLYFNLIGTIVFMILFYTINAVTGGFSFMDDSATTVGIAIVNTAFKLFATAVLTPFVKKLEWLVCKTIPEKKTADDATSILDERFLSAPGYALQNCKQVADTMAVLDVENVKNSTGLLTKFDRVVADRIAQNEEKVDDYEDKLGTYLVRLSSEVLSEQESSDVSKILHAIGDFERISDHAQNLVEAAREIDEKKIVFSPEACDELAVATSAIGDVLELASRAFRENDIDVATSVEPLEEVIDELCAELKNRHIKRLSSGGCTIETGFVFNDIVSNFERIADHCSNIAICVVRGGGDPVEPHEYAKLMKPGNPKFDELYERYKIRYLNEIG